MAHAPDWKVGYVWKYEGTDHDYTSELIEIKPNGDFIFERTRDVTGEKNSFTISKDFIQVSHQEGRQAVSFPLFVGKQWSTKYRWVSKGTEQKGKATVTVVKYEKISTIAGNFYTFKIREEVFNEINRQMYTYLYWYSPEVGRVIKYAEISSNRLIQDRQLVSYKLNNDSALRSESFAIENKTAPTNSTFYPQYSQSTDSATYTKGKSEPATSAISPSATVLAIPKEDSTDKGNPSKSQPLTAKKPDAIAVVIGNQNYSHKDIPPVKYASNDATAVKKYLIETLGYKDGNIIFESDTTKSKLEMIFGLKTDHRGMLFNYVKPQKSDVFIYYSGHGSPDPNTNRAYLVPIDCNPVMMSLTGYPLDVLYGNLPKIEARSVTVVLDACFSGGTNTGKWLVQNASPALIKVNNPVTTQNNITIFTSAKNNQISSWYPEKQHSMFTYFFLEAVAGSADFNQDNQITYQEIYDFVADKAEGVPYYAKRLHGGRIQNPTLRAANKDAVFVSY